MQTISNGTVLFANFGRTAMLNLDGPIQSYLELRTKPGTKRFWMPPYGAASGVPLVCVASLSVSKNLLPTFAIKASERMCLFAVGHALHFLLSRKASVRSALCCTP